MSTSTPWDLRRAIGADALAVAEVHVRSWQAAYRGIVPDTHLDGLNVAARAGRYAFDLAGPDDPETWIALDGDGVVGHVTLGPCRDGDLRGLGEVRSLYVAPDRWRTGAGSALLAKAEQLLLARGFTEASLWVFEANARGRRFYEAAGWRTDGRTKLDLIGGRELVEVRYRKALPERRSGGLAGSGSAP
jgi:GNAT superfamily N-acetyltransferase